jgi:hypothetical protein
MNGTACLQDAECQGDQWPNLDVLHLHGLLPRVNVGHWKTNQPSKFRRDTNSSSVSPTMTQHISFVSLSTMKIRQQRAEYEMDTRSCLNSYVLSKVQKTLSL